MGRKYEVVWNGVNDGSGSDLLNPSLRQARKTPQATPAQHIREQVREGLRLHGPIQGAELARRLGLKPSRVHQEIYHLKANGEVGSREAQAAEDRRFGRRSEREYWLIEQPRIDKPDPPSRARD